MYKLVVTTSFAALALLLGACSGDGNSLTGEGAPGDPSNPLGPGVGPTIAPEKVCAETQTAYVGLGGIALHAARAEALPGVDRGRFKPFTALAGEYQSRLGLQNAPNLQTSQATFGDAPARFFVEPKASAVNVYEAYSVAFRLCAANNTAAPFDSAPTELQAKAECEKWERKAWSRIPTPADIDACVKVAVNESVTENPPTGQRQTTPVRRWAYACAAVYTSAGFLTY